MKRVYAVVLASVLMLGFSAMAFAEQDHQGHQRGHAADQGSDSNKGQIVHEVANAALDELEGKSASSTPHRPPGLSKGRRPPGLEKQDKTPPGWSKGKKEGWNEAEHKEGFFGRLTRVIMRKNKTPETPKQ